VTILRASLLTKAGFLHAFPTRDTPDATLLEALATPTVIQVKQVHGARAVLAAEAAGQEGDALVARAGDGAVGVRVADCVPVLVADPGSGAVAAIHAGWRGVVGGVLGAGVELLGGRGLVAAIGPCIGACCFEVGRDVAAQIGFKAASLREPASDNPLASSRGMFVVREEGDKAYVDLRAAVRSQLRALGLDDASIEDVAGCTRHEGERFHSYRRDGANSGRMLAGIAPARRER
jgi:hypothetical protein